MVPTQLPQSIVSSYRPATHLSTIAYHSLINELRNKDSARDQSKAYTPARCLLMSERGLPTSSTPSPLTNSQRALNVTYAAHMPLAPFLVPGRGRKRHGQRQLNHSSLGEKSRKMPCLTLTIVSFVETVSVHVACH